MKVEKLLKIIEENYKSEDDICVLLWDKPMDISVEQWSKVCADFDEWDNAGADINDWIVDAIIDHSTNEED